VTPDDGCDTEAIVVGVDCTLTPTQEASSTASASGG
jgi:hypothetical protein